MDSSPYLIAICSVLIISLLSIDSLLMCLARHFTNDLLMTARNFDKKVLNEFIRVV